MDDSVPKVLRAGINQHNLTYAISRNRNAAYEDAILYEYGIECTLCDAHGNYIYSEKVPCISTDFNYVYNIAAILAKNMVFPVHLLEILDDLISRDCLPQDDNNNNTPLMCA